MGDPLSVDANPADANRDGTGTQEGFGLSWQDLSTPLGGNNTAGNSRGGSAPLAIGGNTFHSDPVMQSSLDSHPRDTPLILDMYTFYTHQYLLQCL